VRQWWWGGDQVVVVGEFKASRPALQGRRIELAVSRAGRRCSFPGLAFPSPPQPAHEHRPRIQVAGHDAVVEVGDDLLAARRQASPALLPDDLLALELEQRTRSSAV